MLSIGVHSVYQNTRARARGMLIFEYKVDGTKQQYAAIDEAIRIVQFMRNKCLRKWMDERAVSKNDLQCYCAVLAKEFPFAARLNSQARQASADRAWFAISRFYDNCKTHQPGKKGYPRFQRDNRSVEYKQTGWKLEADGRQFAVDAEGKIEHIPTGKHAGIDMGLKEFLTDSEGNTVANPRHLRKAEKRLKTLHRRLSRKQKKSANREKARKSLAKVYLKVQRQREDFARKTASTLISSHDLIAYENLKIANLVKNRKLAKSISDASWGRFLSWLSYYGMIHGIPVIAVEPAWTSQDCSACGRRVKKSLSVRTHICPGCGLVLDRDHNAAINILAKAQDRTGGQSGTGEAQALHNASGQTAATRLCAKKTSKQSG